MDIIRLCAWGYAALLGFVIITGYVPAFIDQNDMIFGLFRRTWYADGLEQISLDRARRVCDMHFDRVPETLRCFRPV
jgi:hypothetical protein